VSSFSGAAVSGFGVRERKNQSILIDEGRFGVGQSCNSEAFSFP
jgi:hypothetical protein